MAGLPADRKEQQAATHVPIRGTPQIGTVIRSPVWALSGGLLLVAVVRASPEKLLFNTYFARGIVNVFTSDRTRPRRAIEHLFE